MGGLRNAFPDHHHECSLENGVEQLQVTSRVPCPNSVAVVFIPETRQHSGILVGGDHEH